MRLYRISVQRWCGEFVCGRVTRAFYDYWRCRDEDSLSAHILRLDSEHGDPDSPPAHNDNTTPDAWHDFDDVAHVSGALTSNNFIHVEEVLEEADDLGELPAKPGGYAESFEISSVLPSLPEDFLRPLREIEISRDLDNPADPVLVCKSLEKGAQTVAICRDCGAFDLAKLKIETWDFDGDEVIVAMSYGGVDLDIEGVSSEGKGMTFYVGDLHDSSLEDSSAHDGAASDERPTGGDLAPPGRLGLVLGTIWPSFNRSLSGLFSILALPLFLLSAISAAKYLGAADLVALTGFAAILLEHQRAVLSAISDFAARYGVFAPSLLIELAVFYLSIGSTVLRAERNVLVFVENDGSDRFKLLKEAFGRGRVDCLFLAIPQSLRAVFVVLAWPILALYRLKTPFIVCGPGPSNASNSTAVARRELNAFAKMASAARGWKGHRVYDFRQIVVWHLLFVAAAGYTGAKALSLVQ